MPRRHACFLALSLLAVAHSATAQGGLVVEHRLFPSPVAAPREPAFDAGLVMTNLFGGTRPPVERPPLFFADSAAAAHELQAIAAMGGTVPVWQALSWPDGGVLVGVQAGVFGRFRIESPARDLVAADWIVGLPIEVRKGRLSARLRPFHWSAHLGDELMQNANAVRIPFSFESLDLLVGYRALGPLRAYGGGSVNFHSDTETLPRLQRLGMKDRVTIQLGTDAEAYPWHDGRLGYVFGVDWQCAQRTDWGGQLSAAAGLTFHNQIYAADLRARFFTGPSPLGQFFRTHETYWGLDLVIEM
ncbi:MAG: DUF1207 domain-containing protein [Gemmatimonadota bacterium]